MSVRVGRQVRRCTKRSDSLTAPRPAPIFYSPIVAELSSSFCCSSFQFCNTISTTQASYKSSRHVFSLLHGQQQCLYSQSGSCTGGRGFVSWFTGFLYFVLYFTPLILTPITKLIVGLRRRLFSCTSPTIQLYWNTITYSRLSFSWRLQELSSVCFHSDRSLIYITPGNTLIYCT
jgi:hypothetical protein